LAFIMAVTAAAALLLSGSCPAAGDPFKNIAFIIHASG
jgi:hypothetical protein